MKQVKTIVKIILSLILLTVQFNTRLNAQLDTLYYLEEDVVIKIPIDSLQGIKDSLYVNGALIVAFNEIQISESDTNIFGIYIAKNYNSEFLERIKESTLINDVKILNLFHDESWYINRNGADLFYRKIRFLGYTIWYQDVPKFRLEYYNRILNNLSVTGNNVFYKTIK